MPSGSGMAGEVRLPPYLEAFHSNWIGSGGPLNSVIQQMDYLGTLANTPYGVLINAGGFPSPDTYVFSAAETERVSGANFANAWQPRVRWSDDLDTIEADITAHLQSVVWDAAAKAGVELDAQGLIATALQIVASSYGELDVTEQQKFSSLLTKAVQEVDALGVLGNINISTFLASIRTGATDEIAAALANLGSISPNSIIDFGSYFDAAKAKESQITEMAYASILSAAQSAATTEVAAAISAAAAAVAALDLTGLSSTVEAAMAIERARRYRRFAGGMADINAVHNSAFLFGLAVIDSEMGREVERVLATAQAQAKANLYGAALSLRPTILANLMGQNIAVENANILAESEFLNRSVISMVSLRQAKAQLEATIADLHQRTYFANLQATMSQEVANKAARDQLISTGVSQMIQLLVSIVELKNNVVGLFERAVQIHTATDLDTRKTNKMARDNFQLAGLQAIGQRDVAWLNMRAIQVPSLHFEAARLRYIADRETKIENLNLSIEDHAWDMNWLLQSAQVLSPGAPGAFVPKGTNRTASALGGALSGAAMGGTTGAAVGGPAAPITAPIGAGIGAVIGLFVGGSV